MARVARATLIGDKPTKIRNVNRKLCKQMRRDISVWEKEDRKRSAWMKNKNVVLTVPNPSGGTRERFMRVNAVDVWGRYDPKNNYFMKDRGPTD